MIFLPTPKWAYEAHLGIRYKIIVTQSRRKYKPKLVKKSKKLVFFRNRRPPQSSVNRNFWLTPALST